jgi:hypothetical protein
VKRAFESLSILLATLAVMTLCDSQADNSVKAPLPPELPMGHNAGRGGYVIVPLRIDGGRELPFLVDTGAAHTLFDKSLEAQLNRSRGNTIIDSWEGQEKAAVYVMPRLYAGDVPLVTGNVTATQDFSEPSMAIGEHVMGVLGMDCLSHYCVQLDFASDKLRFQTSTDRTNRDLGKAFALVTIRSGDERPGIRENLIGLKGALSQVDTGEPGDGWLRPKYFLQWESKAATLSGREAHSPDAILGSDSYSQISLRKVDVFCDGIGLRFLSRHLVTFDFPNRVMYLKRTSIAPLPEAGAAAALKSLVDRIKSGRLPGWSKEDHGVRDSAVFNPIHDSWNIELRKAGDVTVYHYVVKPSSNGTPWVIERGWRTDAGGRTIETYITP